MLTVKDILYYILQKCVVVNPALNNSLWSVRGWKLLWDAYPKSLLKCVKWTFKQPEVVGCLLLTGFWRALHCVKLVLRCYTKWKREMSKKYESKEAICHWYCGSLGRVQGHILYCNCWLSLIFAYLHTSSHCKMVVFKLNLGLLFFPESRDYLNPEVNSPYSNCNWWYCRPEKL